MKMNELIVNTMDFSLTQKAMHVFYREEESIDWEHQDIELIL